MFWRIFGLVAAGFLGGIFGGMGMGGGTLLIPLLTVFCNVPQHAAQAANLLTFIPMAVVALAIHIKKKKVDFKGVLFIIVPASVAAVGTAFVAQLLSENLLKILFGVFLAGLGVVQFVGDVKKKKE